MPFPLPWLAFGEETGVVFWVPGAGWVVEVVGGFGLGWVLGAG